MVEHFGHLVQRPSGMSLLRDLPVVSFGFLTNAVSGLPCGGVTAGSTVVSTPRLFFVNDVDAIHLKFRALPGGSPVLNCTQSAGARAGKPRVARRLSPIHISEPTS